jgi:hypothetical protein
VATPEEIIQHLAMTRIAQTSHERILDAFNIKIIFIIQNQPPTSGRTPIVLVLDLVLVLVPRFAASD